MSKVRKRHLSGSALVDTTNEALIRRLLTIGK
jgi:ribosomal protein L35